MTSSSFRLVAATLFAVIATAHAARLLYAVPVQVGSMSIPVWWSWLGLAVTAALSVWGFRGR